VDGYHFFFGSAKNDFSAVPDYPFGTTGTTTNLSASGYIPSGTDNVIPFASNTVFAAARAA
jgi:hypothetical protein